jgi:hypothetical protein
MKDHKTTQREFLAFQRSFREWQHRFGLTDWRVVFKCEDLEDSFARMVANLEGHIATILLADRVDEYSMDEWDPVRHGRHEAIHLLTYRLYRIGGMRHIMEEELNEEWESLTRGIEAVLDQGGQGGR